MCEADFQIYSIILAEMYNVITINSFLFSMIHQFGDVIFSPNLKHFNFFKPRYRNTENNKSIF